MTQDMRIFTIGHSTRSRKDFLDILRHYHINQLVDIRTIPKSRHNPQFNGPELAKFLRNHHIGYRHQKNLGGYRHPIVNSVNKAWKKASFRGFADYMQTKEFSEGLQKLIEIAHKKTVVIMCSEVVPWRCHRSLIGDALLARGIQVDNIFSISSVKPHTITPWAIVQRTLVTYPLK